MNPNLFGSLRNWLSSSRSGKRCLRPERKHRYRRGRLYFEHLEDRVTPSFSLGGAANYGLLYEGHGGNSLQLNNSSETGNIGIGYTGTFQGNNPGTIAGNIDFSAANRGQFSNIGVTITGQVRYSQTAVTTALNTVNSLSQTFGKLPGTQTTIRSGGSLNVANGISDGSGDRVFTVSAVNFANGTFTINGDAAGDSVVLNIPFAASLNGSIVLHGIASDQVLFNFTPSPTSANYATDYANLSGGPSMTISTNGLATTGVFLDPTGPIQVNHTVITGRVFGGDTVNAAFVSGASLHAPIPPISLVTSASPLVVRVGSGIHMEDTATLSGGNNPTGTITFQLSAPPNLGGGVVYTDVVAVHGDGSYTTNDVGAPLGGNLPTNASNQPYQTSDFCPRWPANRSASARSSPPRRCCTDRLRLPARARSAQVGTP